MKKLKSTFFIKKCLFLSCGALSEIAKQLKGVIYGGPERSNTAQTENRKMLQTHMNTAEVFLGTR